MLCLQAYVPPFLDLRYITSFTNSGADIFCQTFQRRFSRRYVPVRGALPALQPGALAGASSLAGPAAAAAEGAEAAEGASPLAVDAAGLLDAVAEGGEVPLLDDKALADMERSLDKTLGPVDPGLKMQVRQRRVLLLSRPSAMEGAEGRQAQHGQ